MITMNTEWDLSLNLKTVDTNSESKIKKVTGRFDPDTATEEKVTSIAQFINNFTENTLTGVYFTAKSPLID